MVILFKKNLIQENSIKKYENIFRNKVGILILKKFIFI